MAKPLHNKPLWAVQKADGQLACPRYLPKGSAPSLFDYKPSLAAIGLDGKWKFVRVRVVLDAPKRASREDPLT